MGIRTAGQALAAGHVPVMLKSRIGANRGDLCNILIIRELAAFARVGEAGNGAGFEGEMTPKGGRLTQTERDGRLWTISDANSARKPGISVPCYNPGDFP